MLREPQKTERAVLLRKDRGTGRFRIVKLEERIAPHNTDSCHKHGGSRHGYNGGNLWCPRT